MSIDINAACFKHRTYVHLGFLPWAFGHGSNDREGQKLALDYIYNHLGPDCELKICRSDDVPDDYVELGNEAVGGEAPCVKLTESTSATTFVVEFYDADPRFPRS